MPAGSFRVHVLGNVGDDDAGFVGRVLVDAGATLVPLAREEPASWPDPATADALLVLGSEWSVHWPQHADLVEAEAAYLRAVDGRGAPALAVCYGAQLAAHAFGGTVVRAPAPEIGWVTVEAAEGSPMAPVAPGPWFEWHFDTFTVPPGATLLAANGHGPQAYRRGRLLAVQFHPEVDGAVVARWVAGGASDLDAAGLDGDALLAETHRQEVAAAGRAAAIVELALGSA